MDQAIIGGVTLEYEDSGAGEPVICIHGAFIADTFRPLASERALASRYRLMSYHRRGYVGSSGAGGSMPLAEQAQDCRRLLSHLRVRRAHIVGHSVGGAIALEVALDAPQLVHTLSLLEPALMVGDSAHLYRQGLLNAMQRYRKAGGAAAIDEFLQARWPGYRAEGFTLPGATHFLQVEAPRAMAVVLADFYGRHPLEAPVT